MAGADLAAQLVRHDLLAVTDAQDRQAAVEQALGRARASILGHAGGRSRQDDALGLHAGKRLFRHAERRDFGIDARFAHAARDQLRHLAAEIDDKDGVGEMLWVHGRAVTAKVPTGPERGRALSPKLDCKKRNRIWRFLTFVRRGATLFRTPDADPVLPLRSAPAGNSASRCIAPAASWSSLAGQERSEPPLPLMPDRSRKALGSE